MVKVFVYGSLMTGGKKNYLLKYSKKMGSFATRDKYLMKALETVPAALEVRPELEFHPLHYIQGEVYEVNTVTLRQLDLLSNNGRVFTRKKIVVWPFNEDIWCYFLNFHPEVLKYPLAPIVKNNYDWRGFWEDRRLLSNG